MAERAARAKRGKFEGVPPFGEEVIVVVGQRLGVALVEGGVRAGAGRGDRAGGGACVAEALMMGRVQTNPSRLT